MTYCIQLPNLIGLWGPVYRDWFMIGQLIGRTVPSINPKQFSRAATSL